MVSWGHDVLLIYVVHLYSNASIMYLGDTCYSFINYYSYKNTFSIHQQVAAPRCNQNWICNQIYSINHEHDVRLKSISIMLPHQWSHREGNQGDMQNYIEQSVEVQGLMYHYIAPCSLLWQTVFDLKPLWVAFQGWHVFSVLYISFMTLKDRFRNLN